MPWFRAPQSASVPILADFCGRFPAWTRGRNRQDYDKDKLVNTLVAFAAFSVIQVELTLAVAAAGNSQTGGETISRAREWQLRRRLRSWS
jgi:hypothetical protein